MCVCVRVNVSMHSLWEIEWIKMKNQMSNPNKQTNSPKTKRLSTKVGTQFSQIEKINQTNKQTKERESKREKN